MSLHRWLSRKANTAMLQTTQTEPRSYVSLIKTGLLIILVSLLTTACSGKAASRGPVESDPTGPDSTEASATAETGKAIEATLSDQPQAEGFRSNEVADITPVEEPVEAVSLARGLDDMTFGLEQGMSYGEARSRLMDQGWLPHTFTTTAPLADWNDTTVQAMQALGFNEIKVCAGTGIGLCRFEFVYQDRAADNGAVLVVSASTADMSTNGEPTLWTWGIENSVNTTYAEQDFDEGVFSQLLDGEGFCSGITYDCQYEKVAFKDALMIAAPYDFGATKISLFPSQPVSQEAALAYAQILDAQSEIDFDKVETDNASGDENYAGCMINVENGSDTRLVETCFIDLSMTPSGTVSEISFHHAVP